VAATSVYADISLLFAATSDYIIILIWSAYTINSSPATTSTFFATH
jgi:hypothetical protein